MTDDAIELLQTAESLLIELNVGCVHLEKGIVSIDVRKLRPGEPRSFYGDTLSDALLQMIAYQAERS